MNKKIASEIAIGIILIIAIIVGGIFYWQNKKLQTVATVVNNQQIKTANENINKSSELTETLNYCGKNFIAEKMEINGVDIVNRILQLSVAENKETCRNFEQIENIAILKTIEGNTINIKLYESKALSESDRKLSIEKKLEKINSNINFPQTNEYQIKGDTIYTIGKIGDGSEHILGKLAVDDAGWQTYTNDKYGFEFKYPKDWKTNIIPDPISNDDTCYDGATSCNFLFPEKQKTCGNIEGGDPGCVDGVRFGVIKNEKKLQLKNFIEEEYGLTKVSGLLKNNDIEQVKFGNGFIYKFIEINAFDGKTEVPHFWVTLDDGNFFNMAGSYLDEDETEVFNQIISTFKFIK